MKKLIAVVMLVSIVAVALVSCQKKSVQDRLREAQQAFDRGEMPAAIMEANKILEKYPDDPDAFKAHILLSNAYAALRNYDQGRQHLQKIIDKVGINDINGQMAFATKIRLYAMERRYDAATTETLSGLQVATKGTPFYRQMQAWLAQIYEARGERNKARDVYRDIVSTEKDEAMAVQALDMLTGFYVRGNDYDSALKEYKEYLERHPDTRFKYSIQVGIGYYYEKKGEKKKAKEYYDVGIKGYEDAIEKAVDAEEKADLLRQLARALDLTGDKDKAQATRDKVLTDFAQTKAAPMVSMEIAETFMGEKNYPKALAMYKQIQQKYPQFAKNEVANAIAYIANAQSKAAATSPTLTGTPE